MGYYSIKTYLRVKPSAEFSSDIHVDPSNSTLHIGLKHASGGPPRHHKDQLVFHYDGIIQDTSQEAIFKECAQEVVEDVLSGYNATIIAYGQSNSGKTFTMSGDLKTKAHRGIIPRALHRIYSEKKAKPEAEIAIHVSYLEIYNEVIHDLLTEKGPGSLGTVAAMEENGFIEMKGLSQFSCSTEEMALKYFSKGERRRAVAASSFNKESNRSHCIFTIYVERHGKMKESSLKTASKLHLVDLVGFERFRTTESSQLINKEAMNINKSLTFLEQVVSELRKGQSHVSFRQSRLTLLLRDSLGGNSKTVLITCALPEDEHLDETISSLRFAQRVRDLRTSAVVNKVFSPSFTNRRYEKKIANLKQELALHDALFGHAGILHDDLTEQKRVELKSKVEAFLLDKADVDMIPIESIGQVKEIFRLFKDAQDSLRDEERKHLGDITNEPSTPNVSTTKIDDGHNINDCVGEICMEGIHIGVAPSNARPKKDMPGISLDHADIEIDSKQEHNSDRIWMGDHESKNRAFMEFKHDTDEGMQLSSATNLRKSELKMKKNEIRILHENIKNKEHEIKQLEDNISNYSKSDSKECDGNDAPSQSNSINQECEQRIQALKRSRKHDILDLIQMKNDIQTITEEICLAKKALVESFTKWFGETMLTKTTKSQSS